MAALTKITVDAVDKATTYADNMDALASKTGLTTDALQSLEVAAKLGNSSLEAVTNAVNKMQRGLVEGSGNFKKLGLNIADLERLDTQAQFVAVAQAIEGLGSSADKAAARMAIFGRGGNELAGTMKAAAEGAGDLGGALSGEAIAAAAAFKDKTDLLTTAWERVTLQFGAAVAQSPELQQLFTDVTGLLVKAAELIARYADRIAGFFDTMISGAEEAARRLKTAFPGLASALGITGNSISAKGTNMSPVVGGGGSGFEDNSAAIRKATDALEEWQLANLKAETQAKADWLKQQTQDAEDLEKALKQAARAEVDLMLAIVSSTKQAEKSNEEFFQNQERIASENARKMLERIQDEEQAREDHFNKMADQARGVATILGATGDLFVALGAKGDSMFVKLIDGFAGLADAASGVFSALAKGDTLGAIGAGISGVASFIGNVFGDREQEKVNDMRDAFFEAQGGFVALQKSLLAVTDQDLVKKIFDAKTVDEFNAAVAEALGLLDQQALAQEKVRDAMERYGITIDEMGPKFAQQELDKQAMQLFEDYQLLIAAGADHNAVLSKMAPTMSEYVNTAIKAGATIPESMREAIEAMIEQGLLLDENGEAFKTLEESGIKFAESLEEGMSRTIDAIEELVEVLKRLYSLGPPTLPAPNGPPGEVGDPPTHATGGVVRKTGWSYIHKGETVVPYGDVFGGPAPGGGPVPFDPGGSSGGGGGGGGVRGGPSGPISQLERVTARFALARPINIQGGNISVSGQNQTETIRAVVAGIRDNKEGIQAAIGQIARREMGRF